MKNRNEYGEFLVPEECLVLCIGSAIEHPEANPGFPDGTAKYLAERVGKLHDRRWTALSLRSTYHLDVNYGHF